MALVTSMKESSLQLALQINTKLHVLLVITAQMEPDLVLGQSNVPKERTVLLRAAWMLKIVVFVQQDITVQRPV